MKSKLYLLLMILVILLTACATISNLPGFSKFIGKQTTVGGSGVILSVEEGPENNEEIIEGFPFSIAIKIANYVPVEPGLIGELCLRDDKTETYGGVDEDDCREINLQPATSIEKRVTPSEDVYRFSIQPYHDLAEKNLKETVQVFADLDYNVQSLTSATTCIKRPAAQSQSIPADCGKKQDLQLQQTDLPIKVSRLTTRAISTELESTVDLEILLTKVTEGSVISMSSIGQQPVQGTALINFDVLVSNIPAVCAGIGNNLEFRQNEKEKIIKCFVKIPLDQDLINAPIRIKMGYGFKQSIKLRTLNIIKGGIS